MHVWINDSGGGWREQVDGEGVGRRNQVKMGRKGRRGETGGEGGGVCRPGYLLEGPEL